MKVKQSKFEGVYRINGKFATVNLVPGFKSTNEDLVKIDNVEYRIWDYYTSKPAAAFKKGLETFPLKKWNKVLYLGLAEGKTASFFSDIVGTSGIIYGVELSERSLREAIPVCDKRGNMIPILADARRTELYENVLIDKVDGIFIDVASPDQVDITIRNSQKFLQSNGWVMLAIKSQSIDVIKPPKQVYKECLQKLENYFEVLDKVELDPYEKSHMYVVMREIKRNF